MRTSPAAAKKEEQSDEKLSVKSAEKLLDAAPKNFKDAVAAVKLPPWDANKPVAKTVDTPKKSQPVPRAEDAQGDQRGSPPDPGGAPLQRKGGLEAARRGERGEGGRGEAGQEGSASRKRVRGRRRRGRGEEGGRGQARGESEAGGRHRRVLQEAGREGPGEGREGCCRRG